MKKQAGIWIDSSKAVIIIFAGGEESIVELMSDIENKIYHRDEGDSGHFMGLRHINNEKKFEKRKKHQTDHFLSVVIDEIKKVDEVYVFGPAEMKTRLTKKIDGCELVVRNKLKSVETADDMTTNQMVAKTKKYFNL
jgi:hypothetical protein